MSMARFLRSWPLIMAILLLCAGWTPAQATGPMRLEPSLQQLARTNPDRWVQVIVQKGRSGRPEETLAHFGGSLVSDLPIIGAFTARLQAKTLPALAQRSDVRYISADGPVTATGKGSAIDGSGLATSYPQSADVVKLWNQTPAGYTGAGVAVAVLDTGISGAPDFGSRLLTRVAVNSNGTYNADKYGHGTHVAGIIGGNSGGRYIGVAPGVNLVSVKVSDDNGVSLVSDFIKGIQWVIDNKATYGIRVINISATAGNALSYNDDPLDAAVEQAWFAGLVVVVAAGNRGGESCSTCYAPANDPYVITVGAIDDKGTASFSDDALPTWTSSGATQDGFAKPEILAPGSRIVSVLAAPSASIAVQWPQNIVETKYFVMGGTSMAAPVVSGVAALLLQAKPTLTPDQVKWLLTSTARTYRGQASGAPGIVDGYQAYTFMQANPLSAANGGLTPSASLNLITDPSTSSSSYWANSYWANSYWANSCCY